MNANVNDTAHRVRAPPRRENEIKQRLLLRTHKRAFLLLFFYIPLVVVPWVVTMILVHRPLTRSSWTYAPGFHQKDYKYMRGWARAIPIMNAFAAVVAVTVTSTVVAQAAVIFAQRRVPGQRLSVKQLFSLADRVWINPAALPRTVARGKASFKCFVLGATALVLLGALQYPLIQILVSWKDIDIPNCRSTGYIRDATYGNYDCDVSYGTSRNYVQLGIDLEPAQLAIVPAFRIISRVKTQLSQYADSTPLKYLWQDPDNYMYTTRNIEKPGFLAALPAGSTTGVLHEHLMRMNSSISCTNTTLAEFPSTCSGTNPFQGSWEYEKDFNYYNGTLDLCAPGDQRKHPWTLSRNRQDITEEVWVRYRQIMGSDGSEEEVFRCTAHTARGYFELGNVHNGGQYGPLLDKWPSAEKSVYNDWFESERSPDFEGFTAAYFPSEEDHGVGHASPEADPSSDNDAPDRFANVPGPLMISILALFGPASWSHALLNTTSGLTLDDLKTSNTKNAALLQPLCDSTPFARVHASLYESYRPDRCTRSLETLRITLHDFLAAFTNAKYLERRLHAAMFFANEALLTSHTEGWLQWPADTGREIYTASGWRVKKPVISMAAQIILSMIVGGHVFGLLALAFWVYRHPAWTGELDALAIARVAASLDPGMLPPIRATTYKDAKALDKVDGLIGVHDAEVESPRERGAGGVVQHTSDEDIEMRALSVASTVGKEPTSSAVPTSSPLPAYDTSMTLGLGAPGIVPRGRKMATPPAISSDLRV